MSMTLNAGYAFSHVTFHRLVPVPTTRAFPLPAHSAFAFEDLPTTSCLANPARASFLLSQATESTHTQGAHLAPSRIMQHGQPEPLGPGVKQTHDAHRKSSDVSQTPSAHGGVADSSAHPDNYDAETVERIYRFVLVCVLSVPSAHSWVACRKLDMRIIPGPS